MKQDRSALRAAEDRELVEEVLATIRHDVRNKLASARQATHYLKTRSQSTELWATDPRIPRFFALIDSELETADGLFSAHEALDEIHRSSPSVVDPVRIALQAKSDSVASECVDITEVTNGRPYADEAELVVALTALIDAVVEMDAIDPNTQEPSEVERDPPKGLERPTVSVAGKIVDGSYVFSVNDRKNALNDAFFQRSLRPSAKSPASRRGLGLSMVRRIARRYGGSLELVKKDGATCIELSIAETVVSTTASPIAPNPRILLVDDDDSARITFAALLEDEGFEIVSASSSAELTELLTTESPFGVAFVDYHLDGALGTDLVPSIRSHSSDIVVVLVTGDNPTELPKGVDGWIVKGGDPDALVKAVRKYAPKSLTASES